MIKKLLLCLFIFQLVTANASILDEHTPCMDLPVAAFAVDNTSGCAPLAVQFTDFSENATTWNWTFEGGDPSTSSETEPLVNYTSVGTFLATLIVSNNEGSDTTAFSIVVTDPPPTADFSFQLSGMEATFTNNSSGADQYVWEFGDGNSSTEVNPSHTYTEEGVYLVKLISANNCTTKAHTDVVVLSSGHMIPDYTANDLIVPYDGSFLPGINLGYFPPWKDDELADIAAGNPEKGVEGVGVKTIRPALFDFFLETWGYDIRIDEFQHYIDLKLKDNTVIVGFPSEAHRDPNFYCSEHQSELFANLYSDIWDNGENGTPINDENYFALYLFRMVHLYGDNIKFWEIWNEPGFDFTFLTGFLPPGEENSWWDNDPDPCDYKLRAPIQHYVRTLRIAYEVIKYIHPDDYVTLGSVGYPSFMDAILRNTDNPVDGSPTAEYPLGGGAYFDVVTIHSYPHFDGTLRYWDEDLGGFVHTRHSDAAAGGIERTKTLYQEVLTDYGYDDNTYPEKGWIITEINIPRKQFGDYIGGEEVQVNYIIKAYIEAVRNNILNMHIYDMSESHGLDDAVNEFQLMGLYQRLFGVFPYNQIINNEGIAYKTTSDLLYSSTYDVEQTNAMQLPEGVTGHAFLDPNGHYTYVMWATTSVDNSENTSASYTFPASLNISDLEKRTWDFSQTKTFNTIAGEAVSLNARPIFLTDLNNTVLIKPTADFEVDQIQGCVPQTVSFSDQSTTNVTNWNWSFLGGTPATSTVQNPSIVYHTPGTYEVRLTVSNTAGEDELIKTQYIIVNEDLPTADFEVNMVGQVVNFVNTSSNATDYFWDLADGNMSTLANPANDYSINAFYDIVLIASNSCGSDTTVQTIIIGPNQVIPQSDFTAEMTSGCAPLTIQFHDQSSANTTGWWWQFQGGSPSNSSEQNPVVTFNEPGDFFVKLIASNDAGSNSKFKGNFVQVTGAAPTADFTFGTSGLNLFAFNSSNDALTYIWNFGDGNNSTEENPSYTYNQDGTYTLELIAINDCGSDTLSENITLSTLPIAGFSAESTTACAPASVQFINQSSSTTIAWNWSFPGGTPATSNDPNPLVVYETAGNYDVSLQVSNNLGSDQLMQSNFIVVQDIPTASFTSDITNTTIQLNNLSNNAQSYQWFFGDGNSSTDEAPSHTYSQDGPYTLELIAINDCGTDTFFENITVGASPTAGFSAENTTVCAPASVQFINQSSSNTIAWNWSFPGGTPAISNDPNPLVVYENAGNYDVSLEISNDLGSDELMESSFIVVQDIPTAGFTNVVTNSNVQFSNISNDAQSYEWFFGDGNSSTDASPMHDYSSSGDYEVLLIATNNCGNDSISQMITIDIINSIDLPKNIHHLSLFPNPNNGLFTIQLEGKPSATVQLGFINILGQNLKQQNFSFQSGQLTQKFDLSHFSSGAYMMWIQLNEATIYRKIIID